MADFSKINTFIFDVDGVLTDGSVIAFANNEFPRNFFIKDGHAIEKALQMGYRIVIISGGFELGVNNRLTFLGIKEIYLGIKDKFLILEQLLLDPLLKLENILYMGDDIPDIKVLKRVGFPCCPADAAEDVKPVCKYISAYNGGRGAVRDVIEKAQNKWVIDNW